MTRPSSVRSFNIINSDLPEHVEIIASGNTTAAIKAIYHARQFLQSTERIPEGAPIGIILDRTSFYAESGGQEYDTGRITIDDFADFEVTNVQAFKGYVLHIGRIKYGQLDVGNEVLCCYDEARV